MIVYHRTQHAAEIARDGFQAWRDHPIGDGLHQRVWVSQDWPLDERDASYTGDIITLEIPDRLFATHPAPHYERRDGERRDESRLVYASKLNEHRHTIRTLTDAEKDVRRAAA